MIPSPYGKKLSKICLPKVQYGSCRWLPELTELVQQLKQKVDAKQTPVKKQLPLTKVKEFSLTKPRPRSVPLPYPVRI